jgi:hypothetical protein
MTWRSAGDLGLYENVEPEPWERTTPAPPRSDPKRRDRSEEDRRRGGGSAFWTDIPCETYRRACVCRPGFRHMEE